MAYELDKQYTFAVKEKKMEGGTLYYVIEANGYNCDIKAFETQKGKSIQSIVCIFKGYKNGKEPIFSQDFSVLIAQTYKVGGIYEFQVKTDVKSQDYYEVIDKNGLIFRLVDYGDTKVFINQMIKAKVKSINGIRVELSLVTNKKKEGLQFFQPEDLWSLYNLEKLPTRYLNMLLQKSTHLKTARQDYENGNALWVIHAIEAIDKNLANWLTAEYPRHKLRTLSAYHCICINLLENSEYLRYCSEVERVTHQKRIATAITHAEDYIVALNLMDEHREQDYIDDHLERLKNTGYLYNPEKNMRVIMSIFTMRQESVQDYIHDIFDIIRSGHDNERFMSQFQVAFTEMLDVYIWNETKEVNLIPKIYNNVTKQQVEEMVEALAIQLLLLVGIDHEDKGLYRSMLYRYASVIRNDEKLINKSYLSLISREPWPLEYSWDDLEKIGQLCTKLSAQTELDKGTHHALFHGNSTSITLGADSITVTPIQQNIQAKKAYPDGITPWNKIQFMLAERLGSKVTSGTQDINKFRLMWNELERNLFAPNNSQPTSTTKKKKKPSVGDSVFIRITGQNPLKKNELTCVIEDEYFEGDGFLNMRNIVHYSVDATPETFRDRETQCPFLLEAKVEGIKNNGQMAFSLKKFMEDFIYETTRTGEDNILAQVTLVEDTYYLCISELGYALTINKSEMTTELNEGDFILTEIALAKPNGNVSAYYSGPTQESFKVIDAFYGLIHDYANGNLYQNDVDEQESEETILSDTYVTLDQIEELIHIIDRYAMTLESDQIATFNYLEVAKIFSRIIQDEDLAIYFEKRIELVRELKQFSELQKISQETLDKLLKENEGFVSNYPDIKEKLTQLQVISHLDQEWNDEFLWETARIEEHTKSSDLARLVLAHNLLKGFNAFEQQRAINKKIFQTMDLDIQLPETSFVAEEDQVTELKASMIYPADNKGMRPDEKKQIRELLTVVCSMLNSKGGTLYVGVNNVGYAIGLEEDFNYLSKTRGQYDLSDMKDQFDLKFRNSVHDQLGTIANNLVTSSFITVEGKIVYKVEVQPSQEIIFLDKQAYVRQGTSKWPIKDSEMAAFKAQRKRLFSEK